MKRHTWADIKAGLKPETREQIEAEARRLSEQLHLAQRRKARGLTQAAMADLVALSLEGDVSLRVPLDANRDGVVLVAGTRVDLEIVVEAFRHGSTAEEIAAAYPALALDVARPRRASHGPGTEPAPLY